MKNPWPPAEHPDGVLGASIDGLMILKSPFVDGLCTTKKNIYAYLYCNCLFDVNHTCYCWWISGDLIYFGYVSTFHDGLITSNPYVACLKLPWFIDSEMHP